MQTGTGMSRVGLREVEAALRDHPSVDDCVVLAREVQPVGQEMVAYVVVSGPFQPERLRAALPAGAAVGAIVPVACLPLTPDGQIDEEVLLRLDVIDDALIGHWEQRLRAIPGVDDAAVVVRESVENRRPYHLSDIIPGWTAGVENAAGETVTVAAPTTACECSQKSRPPAYSDGGPLVAPTDAPTTLTEALLRTAARYPHKGVLYVRGDGSEIRQTYPELLGQARKILAGLTDKGLKPGDRVILQVEALEDHFAAFWACVLGGITPVTVAVAPSYREPNAVVNKLFNTWELLDHPTILTSARLVSDIAGLSSLLSMAVLRVVSVDELKQYPPTSHVHPSRPDDLIFFQLTSGSTGVPKCIQETHRGVISHIHASQQFNGYTADDVTLNWLPVDHVVPILTIHLRDVYLGCAEIQVATGRVLANALAWLDLITGHRVTHTWSPNFGFKLVTDNLRKAKGRCWDLTSLRLLMNAGEQVTLPVVRDFLAATAPFGVRREAMQPSFGMAEACTCMTYQNHFDFDAGVHRVLKSSLGGPLQMVDRDDPAAVSFVDLGPPVPGVQIRITDDQNRVVPEGVIGRFQIKGDVITPGYLNNPKANQEAFVGDGWFNSGDLGFIWAGRLTLTGREKEMIIVRGANFYCYEIEDVVNAVPGVEPTFAAACAVDDPSRGTEGLAIFFVPAAGADRARLVNTIRAQVTANLGISPTYVLPIALEQFPKTTSGKIQRSQLKKGLLAGQYDQLLKDLDVELGNAHTLPDWFYRPVWRQKQREGAAAAPGGTLIFLDTEGLGTYLARELGKPHRPCALVEPGSEFANTGRHRFRINPRRPADYRRLLESLAADGFEVGQILHLWTYDRHAGESVSIADLDQALDRGAYSLLALAQALGQTHHPKQPVRLLVVSSNAQPAEPDDPVACEKSTLVGLTACVSQELPFVDCRHVDLAAGPIKDDAEYISRELRTQGDREVAYRRGRRLVPRLERVNLSEGAKQPLPFRRGGAYVISGGLGGIGLEVARLLLTRYHARLLLLGRTALPDRKRWDAHVRRGGPVAKYIQTLQSLDELGGTVRYECVDITEPEYLRRVVDAACADWRLPLDGVIQLAGVYRERPLADETRESVATVLRPKVHGTWALHQLVKDRPGALFLHFSSVMGYFGGALFGAYAAANRFLDSFVHMQRRQGLQSRCLAWSVWADLGMSRSRDGKRPLRAAGRGFEELSAAQGLHSLQAVLHTDEQHVLIGLDGGRPAVRRHVESPLCRVQSLHAYYTAPEQNGIADRLQRLEVFDRFRSASACTFSRIPELPRTAAGEIDREQLADADRRARQGRGARVAPRTDAERTVADVWQEVLGISSVGVDDNFFEAGGHSLLAAQVLTRLNESFGRDLSLRDLFEAPTIAGLAKSLEATNGADAGRPAPPLKSVSREGATELSFAQQRLWFFDELAPGTPYYNLPSQFRITGRLNVAVLEDCLREIVKRHEALRTVFRATAGRPHQVIVPTGHVRLDVTDLQHLSGPEREAELRRLATEEACRPFDLARGPVFRAALFRLGAAEHLLVLTAHHIVSDGWSLGLFSRELSALYRAFAAGEPSPLPDLPVQYADYAIWQRGWLQGETLDHLLAYWLKRLAGAAPLKVPTDRPRPPAPGFRGTTVPLALPASLARRLRGLSQAEGSTVFMTLLSVLQALLARVSGQDDVVIGVPVANRNGREVESLIGFFVNTLPVRADLSGNPKFRELLSRTREAVLSDLARQELPFEKLVEELRLPRETARIPLCSALLVFQNGPPPTPELPGLQVDALPSEIAPRSDLDWYLWEEGDEIRGSLVFDRDLFEDATIARLTRQFRRLIENAVHDPDTSLADLTLSEPVPLPAIRPAVSAAGRCPLSFHQERMWFIDEFETGTIYPSHPVYHNLPLLIHLRGQVDEDDLRAALRAVVARHGALRTRVVGSGNELSQSADDRCDIELRTLSLPGTPLELGVEQALADSRRPFALDQGPPVRAALFRLADGECLLAVTAHHLVADRRSLELIAGEVAEFCTARAEARPPRLPEAPLQYSDYTQWQHQLPAEVMDRLLLYWKWQLRGRLRPLELPEDRTRPAIHTFTDARLPLTVGGALARRLAAVGHAEGHGLEAVLLTAWKLLMHRYARQHEVVVGVSATGRTRPEAKTIVGPLANLLALRTDVGGNVPFRTLLARVAHSLQQAKTHQEMPFDLLVRELKPEPDMSRTALFDVLFHFDEEPAALHFGTARGRLIDTNLGHGKYDLHLSLRAGADGLAGSLVYNADIYDRSTAERMLRHFERVLHAVAEDPERPVDDLRLLSAAEERQQLDDWNATRASYPHDRTVHQLFEEQVARTPDRTAVVCGSESLTYRELDERANRLAHHLRDQGVGPDVLVALCLERSAEMIVALLAVLKAGGAYLPLDPEYPAERLRFQVSDARAGHLISTTRLAGRVPAAIAAVTLLDADAAAIASRPANAPTANSTPDNLIYCLYTSGSTGTPKGVLLEHRNVVRLMVNDRLQFTFTADDVWTMFHSYCFDFSVWEMYGALLYGGKLVVVPRAVATDPAAFLSLLERERVTVLNQTPSAFGSLLREVLGTARKELALRYVVFGGEALSPGLLRPWRAMYPAVKMINMYGITETTVHVTFKEIRDEEVDRGVSNIGVPIPTMTTYVMDAGLRLLPVGVPGELCVGGDGVCRGYLRRPELTAQRFVPNPYRPEERLYRSGDLAKLLSNGELVYLGRIDDQVQVRGFRVELGEVRSQILRHPAVAAAEVVAWQPAGQAVELAAYVVPKGDLSVAGLRNHLTEALPHYMIPSAIVLMPALPLTANGKVNKKALPPPQDARSDAARGFVPPRDPVEQRVADIWAQVLGVARVGALDNFFELGGHSLRATQVLAQISESFGIKLALSNVFEAPTVTALARRVEAARGTCGQGPANDDRQAPPLARVTRTEAMPLSFAQHRLWFMDQLVPGSPSYNIPLVFRLTGDLRPDVLERSIGELLRRHEVLRTNFPVNNGQPAQRVAPLAPCRLPFIDLSDLTSRDREAAVGREAEREAQRPFDLSRDPLLRARLLRLGGCDHLLLVTVHHIAVDGWSLPIVTRELSRLYEAFAAGKPSPLPELPIQYADFADWQRRWLQGEVLQEHADYWKKQLAGAPAKLELASDRLRPAVQTLRGARLYFGLPAELAEATRVRSQSEGTTLFMTLLAAFKAFLYASTGQDDLLVGSPFANRTRSELEHLIGPFVNTVVLRTRVSADMNFRGLLERVRAVVLGASAHQEFPFEKVVEALRPPRDPSRNPVFQVNFRVREASLPSLQLPGTTSGPPEITDSGNSKFDLALELTATADGFGGFLEYSTDLFEEATVARMRDDFARLLGELLARPDCCLNELAAFRQVRARREEAGNAASNRRPTTAVKGLREARRRPVGLQDAGLNGEQGPRDRNVDGRTG